MRIIESEMWFSLRAMKRYFCLKHVFYYYFTFFFLYPFDVSFFILRPMLLTSFVSLISFHSPSGVFVRISLFNWKWKKNLRKRKSQFMIKIYKKKSKSCLFSFNQFYCNGTLKFIHLKILRVFKDYFFCMEFKM